jgi:hypothetical protein
VLAKYLAGALHHAAVELAFDYRVIDHVTAVVDSAMQTISAAPVSESTSTSAMWQPLGRLKQRCLQR